MKLLSRIWMHSNPYPIFLPEPPPAEVLSRHQLQPHRTCQRIPVKKSHLQALQDHILVRHILFFVKKTRRNLVCKQLAYFWLSKQILNVILIFMFYVSFYKSGVVVSLWRFLLLVFILIISFIKSTFYGF